MPLTYDQKCAVLLCIMVVLYAVFYLHENSWKWRNPKDGERVFKDTEEDDLLGYRGRSREEATQEGCKRGQGNGEDCK